MTRVSTVLLVAVASAGLLAAAVAGSGGSPAATPEERARTGTLRVGQFSWAAAEVTTAILAEIVRRHDELGVVRFEAVETDPEDGWSKLAGGELDVLPEVFLPNQYEYFADARATAELVHRTYSGAVNAWYVPRYAVAPGGPAAGLSSISQLRNYRSVFDNTLFDGEPGWVTTAQNADRIAGFRLGLDQETGTEAELIDELRRRYEQRRPILLYLWRPHWVHAAYDLVELEEPNGYSVNCFDGGEKACAMPTNDVWLAAREDVRARFPHLWRLLTRFEVPLDDVERMLAHTERAGRPARTVAREWVDANAATISTWLAG